VQWYQILQANSQYRVRNRQWYWIQQANWQYRDSNVPGKGHSSILSCVWTAASWTEHHHVDSLVQTLYSISECNVSVSTVWLCECEVHSFWRWMAWNAFVNESFNGKKLLLWDLRGSNVQLCVNAWSWLIITNPWQSLSIPILTAGGNLQCQIMSHDQTSALHGNYNSLCW
jgi:hypothetical protein